MDRSAPALPPWASRTGSPDARLAKDASRHYAPSTGSSNVDAVYPKLEYGAELSDEDRRALEEAASNVREIGPRQDIISQGERPEDVHVVVEGWACRYKLLPDGGRQIMAYLVPGHFCDLHMAILGAMDHGIATVSKCKVC